MRISSVTIAVLLCAASSLAAPDPLWELPSIPTTIAVADFDGRGGLEGLIWDPAGGPSDISILLFSFADGTVSRPLPDTYFPNETVVRVVDLNRNDTADVLILTTQPREELIAYEFLGGAWRELWRNRDIVTTLDALIEKVEVGRDDGYLLFGNAGLLLLDPLSGQVAWDANTFFDNPNGLYQLVDWTEADFDGSLPGPELLLEILDLGIPETTFLMITENQSVSAGTPLAATAVRLGPSRPNPMQSSTSLRFELPQRARVNLSVVDARGRRVRRYDGRVMEAGEHLLHWDGRDDDGASVADGVYFFELVAGRERLTRKMVVVK